LQVKYADGELERLGTRLSKIILSTRKLVYVLLVKIYFVPHSTDISTLLLPEHKLFVGMLPKNVTDAEMTDLFSQYGNIKDLQILRGSQQTSKGKIFVWKPFLFCDSKRVSLFLLGLSMHLAAYQLWMLQPAVPF
jgi:hypothetical protein